MEGRRGVDRGRPGGGGRLGRGGGQGPECERGLLGDKGGRHRYLRSRDLRVYIFKPAKSSR